jgi:hypothetical protein
MVSRGDSVFMPVEHQPIHPDKNKHPQNPATVQKPQPPTLETKMDCPPTVFPTENSILQSFNFLFFLRVF